MGRTRQVIVDFDDNLWVVRETLTLDGPIAPEDDYTVVETGFPVYYNASSYYTQIVIWGVGLVSFGPITAAQKAFIANLGDGSDFSAFPGDHVAFGFSANQYDSFDYGVKKSGYVYVEAPTDESGWYGGRVTITPGYIELQGGEGYFEHYGIDFGGYTADSYYGSAGLYLADLNVTIGSSAADILSGAAAPETLIGLDGDDTLNGGDGNDVLYGDGSAQYGDGGYDLTGNDTLNGGAGDDLLFGRDGDDTLNGGTGADAMYGGYGNDIYVIDHAGDTVNWEENQPGTDTVRSSISYTLPYDVENLTLTGTASIRGTGNELANTLIGNSAANVLDGGVGADTLTGAAGNDTLNGGAGADTLNGGTGNDIYIVDNNGDLVVEASAGGTDTVKASVTHALATNVEKLTLTGTGAINGTGNGLANIITGNAAANILSGGAGVDQLKGGGGNDTLFGGEGSDTLTGSAGSDKFMFDAPLSATINVDRIVDFSVVNDTIGLDISYFTNLPAVGTLSAAAFYTGTAAHDADDRIIHDKATGKIYYDADGNGGGAQVLFCQVTAGLALTNADFLIVS